LNKDEVKELNEKILSLAQINHDPSEYVLGPGDLLQIKVFEAEELASSVRVSSRGFVTLPLIGQIRIKGLTAREAEQEIEDNYRGRYILDPHVSIFVAEHFSQRITLVGQFKEPGTYDYLAKQTLLDVIALGGGLSEKAGQIVQIRRGGNDKNKQEMYIVDLDQLIRAGNEELNIAINGGDVLFVPEAGVFFVDGAVRRPGAYPIKHRTIVQEALMEAGGLASYANKETLQLVRVIDGERKVINLDLNKNESKEIVVKDRDVLIAGSSAMGKLVHGFNLFIGIPGVGGAGYRDPEYK
jgi:polysaccharide export outer membrane protein